MSTWPDLFEAPRSGPGQPVWDLARWMPAQGSWTEDDYFELQGPAVEFDQGSIEVLPMPNQMHQLLVQFFFLSLHRFVHSQNLGRVLVALVPVKLWEGKFREPDVAFIRADRISDTPYCDGADLVLEVMSEGSENRRRDSETKPIEYAKAGIAEYWLLDPVQRLVRIHTLDQATYRTQDYHSGQTAPSIILSGFEVDVASWLQA